jgi:hypothetical protein
VPEKESELDEGYEYRECSNSGQREENARLDGWETEIAGLGDRELLETTRPLL